MPEYKLLAVSQWWTNSSLADKATREINRFAVDGWRVVQMQHGWNGFLVSTLYVLLERGTDKGQDLAAEPGIAVDRGRLRSSDIQSLPRGPNN
jgi:hypothetical protein